MQQLKRHRFFAGDCTAGPKDMQCRADVQEDVLPEMGPGLKWPSALLCVVVPNKNGQTLLLGSWPLLAVSRLL